MYNSIAFNQNKIENINKLKAQSQVYTDVKFWMIISALLGVILPFIISIIIFILNNDWFAMKFSFIKKDYGYFGAFITIVFTIINECISVRIMAKKEEASKIQELFDTEVFNLDWDEINIGEKPDISSILDKKDKFNKKNPNFVGFNNWYTQKAANYNYPKSIILCQQQNLHWDNYLRKQMLSYSTYILYLMIFLVVLFWFINDLTFRSFVVNVASVLLPMIIFLAKLKNEHSISIAENNRLKSANESMIRELDIFNNDSIIISKCRTFQTAIFTYRKTVRPIPDFMHRLFKNKQEQYSEARVEQIIE